MTTPAVPRPDRPDRPTAPAPTGPGRPRVGGLLLGVGIAAFLDETVFHQLLHWHHLYDRSTTSAGLVSDGVFHAFGGVATVVGLVLLMDVRRRRPVPRAGVLGAVLAGWGTFQVYDGLVQHKVLRMHQIRYGVDLLPYDVVWDLAGAVGPLAGLALLARGRAGATPDPDPDLR